MFDPRPRMRNLLTLAVSAVLMLLNMIPVAAGRIASAIYEVGAYAFNAIASFGAFMAAGLLGLAPSRADELLPLERVKLIAAESRSMAAGKRERPQIFAGWRMSPST